MLETDGIIFDLDGTLWDAVEVNYDSWMIRLDELSIPHNFDLEDFRGCMGLPMDKFLGRLFPDMPRCDRDVLGEDILSFENQYLETHNGILYPDLRETLTELKKNIPLAIVSNSQDGYIQAFLKVNQMEDLFADFESYGGTKLYKADNIRLVTKRQGFKKPVYVGDIQGDADAAHAAGVPIIFAAYGFGQICDAEETIYKPKDLLTVVKPL